MFVCLLLARIACCLHAEHGHTGCATVLALKCVVSCVPGARGKKEEQEKRLSAASNPQLLPVQALAESGARTDALAASLDRTWTSVQRLEQELAAGEQQREERQHASAQVWACCRAAWAAPVHLQVQQPLRQPLQGAAACFSPERAMLKGVLKEAVFAEPATPSFAE